MSDPEDDDPAARGDVGWPRLPLAPRTLEHAEALVELSSDGHREFVWMIPFFLLGGMLAAPLTNFGMPAPLFLAGPLLGAWIGRRLARRQSLRLLRDGVETRCAVVRIIEGHKQPSVVYSYTVDGKESRHDVTNHDRDTLTSLPVGTPVLVLRDRDRVGRHIAFVAPRFPAVQELIGEVAPVEATAVEAAPAARPAPTSMAMTVSRSPYRDPPPGPIGKQLPPAPRPVPARALPALQLDFDARRLGIIAALTVPNVGLALAVQQELLDPSSPALWIPVLLLTGMLAYASAGWWLLTRTLLRRGIETTGTVTAIEPLRERTRVSFRYQARGQDRDWAMLAEPQALAVAVGDTVPVLYHPGQASSWLCVAFVTHEAQALLAEWATRPQARS